MNRLIFFALASVSLINLSFRPAPAGEGTENLAEARKGFEYLNRVRAQPANFSAETRTNLQSYAARPALVWNDTLYSVALAKAQDMARRGYFGHVDPDGNGLNLKLDAAGYRLRPDWLKQPGLNYFESIHAGSTDATEAIQLLIEDKGFNPPGHRNHLLGVGQMRENAVDAAIAYVNCADCTYKSYMVIIIAKHDF